MKLDFDDVELGQVVVDPSGEAVLDELVVDLGTQVMRRKHP